MSPPHFFKLIYEETLKEKMLRLPKKFIRVHGETLSKDVIVELPCGSTWKMGLKKSVGSSGMVWLKEGWTEFAKHFSIKRGHLLVFRYEGTSRFHVVICDMTTCEIDYPPNPVENQRRKRKETKEENFQSNKRTRNSPSGGTPSNFVSPRSKATERDETKGKQIVSDEGGEKEDSLVARRSKADVLRALEKLTPIEKAKALQVASCFKSSKNHFIIVMQPSYVVTSCLKIPTKFARTYLKKEAREVELKVGKRTWSVNYSFGLCTTTNQPTPRFNNGWRKFAEENNLDIGDVCAFVLTQDSSSKASFDVTIFRANENANFTASPGHEDGRTPANEADSDSDSGSSYETHIPGFSHCPPKLLSEHISTRRTRLKPEGSQRPRRSLTTAEKDIVLEKARFRSKCPSFRVVMQPSYTSSTSYLPVPFEFAKEHIKKNQVRMALKLQDGRSWPAEYKSKQPKGLPKTTGLYGGWAAFAVANKLEVGDVCIFELVNATEISFRISIVRLADDAYRELCKGSEAAASSNKLERSVTVKVEISDDH